MDSHSYGPAKLLDRDELLNIFLRAVLGVQTTVKSGRTISAVRGRLEDTAMRPRSLLPYMQESFRSFAQAAQDQSTPDTHDLARKDPDARHRRLSDQADVAVYSCDASGVITYYNGQAVTLWGRLPIIGDTDERFCGSHMLYRVDGSFMPHDQSPMADVLSGKVSGVFNAEVHIEQPGGSRVIVIVNIAPLIDGNGVIVGAINSFYEATHRKPANGSDATT